MYIIVNIVCYAGVISCKTYISIKYIIMYIIVNIVCYAGVISCKTYISIKYIYIL